jgi:Domain of unknown function (DUF3332)
MKDLECSKVLARRALLMGMGSLTLSGCFGSFAATRKLWDWNNDVGNKWLEWLVFLGLCIIPVYSLFVLADVLVLNSLEFWTGDNPVGQTKDGRRLARHATDDPRTVRVEVSRDGHLEQVVYFRRVNDSRMQMLDEERRVVADVRGSRDGSVQLRGARGQVLLELSAEQRHEVEAQIVAGQAAPLALGQRLNVPGEQFAGDVGAAGARL